MIHEKIFNTKEGNKEEQRVTMDMRQKSQIAKFQTKIQPSE